MSSFSSVMGFALVWSGASIIREQYINKRNITFQAFQSFDFWLLYFDFCTLTFDFWHLLRVILETRRICTVLDIYVFFSTYYE